MRCRHRTQRGGTCTHRVGLAGRCAAGHVSSHRQPVVGVPVAVAVAAYSDPIDTAPPAGPETVVVEDIWGNELELTPGVLDMNAREAYLNGHCASLALAIHGRAPNTWTLEVLEGYEGEVVHVVVRTEDGDLLDVDNAHTTSSMLEVCSAAVRVRPADRDEIVDLTFNGDLAPLELGLADTFVDAVLRNGGYDPATWQVQQ